MTRTKYNFYVWFIIIFCLNFAINLAVYLIWRPSALLRFDYIVHQILATISVVLIMRGLGLKIDSSLLLGIFYFGVAIIGFVNIFAGVPYGSLWPYYFLAGAFANFANRVFFFDRLQGFFAIICVLIFIISLCFDLKLFGWLCYTILVLITISASVMFLALRTKR